MFLCADCGATFDEAIRITEHHGFTHPPYEVFDGCPVCFGTYVAESVDCDCCGEKIVGLYVQTTNGKRYCEHCFVFRDSTDIQHPPN